MMAYDGLGFENFAADVDTDELLVLPETPVHGVRMMWPVRPCRLMGDYVVAFSNSSSGGTYNPFSFYYPYGSAKEAEGSHSLYVRLANLAASPDTALLAFCAHFGLPDYPMDIYGVRRWDHDHSGAIAYPVGQIRALAGLLSEAMTALDLWASDRFTDTLEQLSTLDSALEPLRQTRGWVDGDILGASELDIPAQLVEDFWHRQEGEAQGADHDAPDGAGEDVDLLQPDLAFLYWTGENSDDVHALATRWDVLWQGQRLGDLIAEYWDAYYSFMLDRRRSDPDWSTTGYRHELGSFMWRGADDRTRARVGLRYLLRELWLIGDPRRASYDSLEAALLAMLLRDAMGGGRFVKCPECGRALYAQHARQRYCPPDHASGNPRGCAKRRADRLAQQRRRAARSRPDCP